jgi:myo-inositol 2-dehydrogenase / D-chiro-inositol 1-dehydrogenase
MDEAPGIESFTMESDPPIMPDENGQYPIVFPGDYNPFA